MRSGCTRLVVTFIAGIVLLPWCVSFGDIHGDKIGYPPITSDNLTFGFLPMESPVSLFKRFAPLREYLSTQIQKEIRLETAKDFPSFVQRTAERHYDIVFTAPHMALLALDSDKYQMVATFTQPLTSVIVVKAGSDIQDISALQGKNIATPPKQAIVTMVGMNYLTRMGMRAVNYKMYQTHNAAYSAVLGGETDAALIANFIARKAIANNVPLKIIGQSESFPGVGILVARDLPELLKQDIKNAILGMKELPNGKKILEKISQPGYGAVQLSEFEALRPFVQAALH